MKNELLQTPSKVTFNLDDDSDQVPKPLKVILHGPPAAGKTTLAKKLCRRYGAKYVNVKTVIDQTIDDLRKNIQLARALMEPTTDPSDQEDQVRQISTWQEQLKYINKQLGQTERKKLPDEYIVGLMKTFLLREDVQNCGYILDGYPKTIQQAKELFGQAAEKPSMQAEAVGGIVTLKPSKESLSDLRKSDDIGSIMGNATVRILPDYVISLDATNLFLCDRIMRLSETVISGTHYDEPNMIRRMAEFRLNNTVDKTVLRFFDESGIHPIIFDIMKTEQQTMETTYWELCKIFGDPIPGLGISEGTEEELRQIELEQQLLEQEQAKIDRELIERAAIGEYQEKMEKWAETLDKLKVEEEKVVVAQSEPLRFYLMRYVFPVLTKGLIEIARTKPDDPVDFLAEFLFRENPEGKMFDPSYTKDGVDLLRQYDSTIDPTMKETLPKVCSTQNK